MKKVFSALLFAIIVVCSCQKPNNEQPEYKDYFVSLSSIQNNTYLDESGDGPYIFTPKKVQIKTNLWGEGNTIYNTIDVDEHFLYKDMYVTKIRYKHFYLFEGVSRDVDHYLYYADDSKANLVWIDDKETVKLHRQ